MNKKQLDNEIYIYLNNEIPDQLTVLSEIENKVCNENIWQISNSKNINNTSLTDNRKILYLYQMNSFLGKDKRKLKEFLNEFIFPFIMDYLNTALIAKTNVRTWTICQNLNDADFYYDKSRNEVKNSYTVLVFLNDNYIGGEVQFKDRLGNELISFKTGDVLIYPSNEEYLHKAMPVTSGTQYVAITYL